MNIKLQWTKWHLSKEKQFWFIQYCWLCTRKKLLVKHDKWLAKKTVFGYIQIRLSKLVLLILFSRIESLKTNNSTWNRIKGYWSRPRITSSIFSRFHHQPCQTLTKLFYHYRKSKANILDKTKKIIIKLFGKGL